MPIIEEIKQKKKNKLAETRLTDYFEGRGEFFPDTSTPSVRSGEVLVLIFLGISLNALCSLLSIENTHSTEFISRVQSNHSSGIQADQAPTLSTF